MKKVGNIIVAVMVGFIWVYFLYRFRYMGNIARILMLILLVPYTAKVVYAFLLDHSQNKAMSQRDELADSFTPISAPTAPVNSSSTFFCTECGAQNQPGTKFCAKCGKQL